MLVGWVRRAERAFTTTNLGLAALFEVTYNVISLAVCYHLDYIYHIYRRTDYPALKCQKLEELFAFASI